MIRDEREEEYGTLRLYVLKKYRPKKIYGPYDYPNVLSSVWKEMREAVGGYGTGAGTIFWRKNLVIFETEVFNSLKNLKKISTKETREIRETVEREAHKDQEDHREKEDLPWY